MSDVEVEDSGVVADSEPQGGVVLSKEDLDLLNRAKIRQDELYKEQVRYQQNLNLFRLEKNKRIMERIVAFKEGQLESGEMLEKDDLMVDGVKHPEILKNDIDSEKVNLRKVELELEALKLQMEERRKAERKK